jgi:hypothetical protein
MRSPTRLSPRTRALHLFALSAFAIAQPMFQMLGANPVYFAVQGFHALDVVVFGIALLIVVPALAMGVELVAWLIHPRAEALVHQLFVIIFTFLVLARALRSLPLTFAIVCALALAVFAGRVYSLWQPARLFLTVCAFAPILFVSLFLLKMPLGALSATGSAAGTMPVIKARTDVVLVIFDEFAPTSLMKEDGSIDAVRFPNFAALAQSSTWYRNATTVSDATDWAVPAILTGQLSRRNQLPVVGDHPRNVFTLLGQSHVVHSFQAVTRLCPASICPNAFPPFRTRLRRVFSDVKKTSLLRLPDHTGDWASPAKETSDFIASLKPTERPQLAVIHLLLPHEPLQYLPSGRTYDGADSIDGYKWDRWTHNAHVVGDAYQRYLLQVGYADRLLGRLVLSLKKAGLWKESLVVVTADHGVSFRPGGKRRLVDSRNIPDIAPIPLFVKQPGQVTGAVDQRLARSIDIVPTIAEVLRIHIPWRLDGKSLLAPDRGLPAKIVVRSFTRDIVKVTWKRVATERDATIGRKVRMFGSGNLSFFAPAPYRRLIGKDVSSFRGWTAETMHAEIRWPASTRFDPTSSYVPCRIAGTVSGGPARRTLDLAVTVNGRVEAVSSAFRFGGVTHFSTFIPESALRTGPNAIAIFAIRSSPSGKLQFAEIGSKRGQGQ